MRAFMSVWRRQFSPAITIPHKARAINGYTMSFERSVNKGLMRTSPYPPSFRRTAARIIEPAMGASTWALGSQRCTPKRGSLIKKATRQPSHNRWVLQSVRGVGGRWWRDEIQRVPKVWAKEIRAMSSGRDPVSV